MLFLLALSSQLTSIHNKPRFRVRVSKHAQIHTKRNLVSEFGTHFVEEGFTEATPCIRDALMSTCPSGPHPISFNFEQNTKTCRLSRGWKGVAIPRSERVPMASLCLGPLISTGYSLVSYTAVCFSGASSLQIVFGRI
jgi:hypothetical protein